MDTTNTTTTPTLVLMVGGPGAGKSTVRKARFGALPYVCADEIKATHPDYDPRNPMAVHSWSTRTAVQRVLGKLAAGETFVYDSTGTNLGRMLTIVNAARAAGHRVVAVLVSCDVETAVARNAARERSLAEYLVREIHTEVAEAWLTVRSMVDAATVVDNG
jgi:predicted kinase